MKPVRLPYLSFDTVSVNGAFKTALRDRKSGLDRDVFG